MSLTDTLVYLSIGSQVLSIGVRKYFFNIIDRLNNKEDVPERQAKSFYYYLIFIVFSCSICGCALIAVQFRFIDSIYSTFTDGRMNQDINLINMLTPSILSLIFLILLISFFVLVMAPLKNKIKIDKKG